jgi:hypothetical protein
VARGTSKNDSFIQMVLDISGRVRPADLHGVPEAEREPSIASFYERHAGDMQLYLEGEALVKGVAPSPDAIRPAPQTTATEQGTRPDATPSPAAMGATDEELDLIGEAVEPQPEPPAPQSPAEPGATQSGSAAKAPGSARSHAPARKAKRPAFKPERWMLWWIPAILVPALGGFAAWFANRRKRAAVAQAMLIVSLLIGVVATIAFVANAENLAAFFVRTTEKQVIVLPPSKAPGSAPSSETPPSPSDSKQ